MIGIRIRPVPQRIEQDVVRIVLHVCPSLPFWLLLWPLWFFARRRTSLFEVAFGCGLCIFLRFELVPGFLQPFRDRIPLWLRLPGLVVEVLVRAVVDGL